MGLEDDSREDSQRARVGLGMKKMSREELLSALRRVEESALTLTWALRQASCFRGDAWIVIERPRYGAIVARTDEYGVPSGVQVDPEDSPACSRMLGAILQRSDFDPSAHADADSFMRAIREAKVLIAGKLSKGAA